MAVFQLKNTSNLADRHLPIHQRFINQWNRRISRICTLSWTNSCRKIMISMCLLFPPQTVSRRATTRLGVWREMCVNVVRDLWDTDVAPVSHGFSLVRYLCLKIIICREYLGSVFENIQCVHKYSSDSKHLLQTNGWRSSQSYFCKYYIHFEFWKSDVWLFYSKWKG